MLNQNLRDDERNLSGREDLFVPGPENSPIPRISARQAPWHGARWIKVPALLVTPVLQALDWKPWEHASQMLELLLNRLVTQIRSAVVGGGGGTRMVPAGVAPALINLSSTSRLSHPRRRTTEKRVPPSNSNICVLPIDPSEAGISKRTWKMPTFG